MRTRVDDEKIRIGAQPQCLERPSVATRVTAQPDGGGYWRAAPRARTEPIDRASIRRRGPAATQRFDRDAWAAGRMAWLARLTKVRMGRRTHDVSGTWALAWRSTLTAATSVNSLFAR